MILKIHEPTPEELEQMRRTYHRKFAFLPTRVSADEVVWLTFFERRKDPSRGIKWSRRIGDTGEGYSFVYLDSYC